jgi:ABC-type uncharacterized transport system permease subunit
LSISLATFLLRQTISAAAPMVLAGLGELTAELTGVIDIGIEGIMLSGALAAFLASFSSGHGLIGLGAGILVGALMAGIFAASCIGLGTDQIVVGTAINLLALGATGTFWMLFQNWTQNHNLVIHLSQTEAFTRLPIPWLEHIPLIGPAIFDQYALVYVTAVAALIVAWILNRTRMGLVIKGLGDSPETCAAAGIRVNLARTLATLFAGGCAGAAGAYLSIMQTHTFAQNMTDGIGFVVLSLVIFGRWTVSGLIAGCMLFGAINSLQQTLQTARYTSQSPILHAMRHLPFELFQMLPYVAALLALAVFAGSRSGPRYLGKNWLASR